MRRGVRLLCTNRESRQHAKGKLTAKERISLVFDTFRETGRLVTGRGTASAEGESVVCGRGTIHGRPVYGYAQDFCTLGGTLSEYGASKIVETMRRAESEQVPVIGMLDSGGARVQEGIDSLDGFGRIFRRNVVSTVPQLTMIMGPCAGGAAYSPALTDFVMMVDRTSSMFVTGPRIIETVTHESTTMDALGGPDVHERVSGVCHDVQENDVVACRSIRDLVSYFHKHPSPNPPYSYPNVGKMLPDEASIPYDVLHVIEKLSDPYTIREFQPRFATNIVTALARMNGRTVAWVANQPRSLAGCIDIPASQKASRFIRTMAKWKIPILTLVDTPGFLPGVTQEHAGILHEGSRMIEAYVHAAEHVPTMTIILRKAYGGAYIGMGSKSLGIQTALAWEGAEIAVMGAAGAATILGLDETEYQNEHCNTRVASQRGYVDDVIHPSETRDHILEFLSIKDASTP